MRKKPRKFSREFKLEAVRLVEESGKPMSQIARELGIGADLLGDWRRQLSDPSQQHVLTGLPAKRAALEEENRQLKLELERVMQERDILKKAAAYFAREAR